MVLLVVGTFAATMIIFIVGSCYFCWRYKIFNEQRKVFLQNNSWHLTSFQKVTMKEYEIANFTTIQIMVDSGKCIRQSSTMANLLLWKNLGGGSEG
jgi:hypothetical protein